MTTPTDVSTSTDASREEQLHAEIEDLSFRVSELEADLEDAEGQVFELGLEADPVQFAPVVECDTSQGPLFLGDWLGDNYWTGPVGFFRLVEFLSIEEPFLAAVVGVEAGDSVTLVVPRSERDRYSLKFPPVTSIRGDTVVYGVPAVTLDACDGTATAFRGGFATTEEYCAPLDVFFGENSEPARIVLPFGGVDCPDGLVPLETPELGPLPDVTGLMLREARLAIRLVALVPRVNDGDPIDPDGMVWAQEPSAGETFEQGTVIGLRTCLPADEVAATYQERLQGTGVTLSHAWMAPNHDANLESWYFISALVVGGATDGQVATWALPAFTPGNSVDSINTPGLSIPANDISQTLDFGSRLLIPDDYGAADWLDIDGALASQRCVTLSTDG